MRAVSIIPRAVSGLTKADAPSSALVPAGRTRQSAALDLRYCAYIAPAKIDTVFPSSAWASGDAPAFVTTPAPSLPTAIDLPTRPANARNAAGAIGADTTFCVPAPDAVAAVRSAAASKSQRSEGLIGVASTRTTTSSSFGVGTGTRMSDNSSAPSGLTSDRSSMFDRPRPCSLVGRRTRTDFLKMMIDILTDGCQHSRPSNNFAGLVEV